MTKRYNVIPIEDYYVVIEPSKGFEYGKWIFNGRELDKMDRSTDWTHIDDEKVIATIGKRIDSLPLIEISEEPENSFNKLAHQMYPEHAHSRVVAKAHMRIGYKAATKTYTKEDMEAACTFGMALERLKNDKGKLSDTEEFKGFLTTLKKPISSVELEVENAKDETYGEMEGIYPIVSETNTITPINVFYE